MTLVLLHNEKTSLNKRPRCRLYGKKTTVKELVDEIIRLRNNGITQRKIPMTWNEIKKTLGMSRSTLYYYRDVAIELGLMRVDENRREIISDEIKHQKDYLFLEKNEFANDFLIKEWVEDLRSRRNGMPIKSWKNLLSCVRFLCNRCKIHPEQLIIDRKTTEKIVRNFAEMYKTGEITIRRKSNIDLELSVESAIHSRVMAVRSFCAFHGLSWPRGTSSIMSGRVIGHGKYSHIRFTTKEMKIANRFIKKKWGIHSDIFRVFWIGVESCARKTALLNMKCDWIVQKNKDKNTEIFVMKAIETKTNYIKNGQWFKYITRKNTKQSLKKHKSNGFTKIIETHSNFESKSKELRENLKNIYRHVGKTDDYFYTNPFHALRHIGAHYWLEKTNYNYGIVAKIGGWHTIDELKNSYGEMSPEFIIEKLFVIKEI